MDLKQALARAHADFLAAAPDLIRDTDVTPGAFRLCAEAYGAFLQARLADVAPPGGAAAPAAPSPPVVQPPAGMPPGFPGYHDGTMIFRPEQF